MIDPTFTDSYDGLISEEEEGMLADESNDDDNSNNGVDATQNQSQVVDPADPQKSSPSIAWKDVSSFTPKVTPSAKQSCKITHDLTKTSLIYDIFLKIWPWNLFIQMFYYTNQRLKTFKNQKQVPIKKTNLHEMMFLVGCLLVMCFNMLPAINCY